MKSGWSRISEGLQPVATILAHAGQGIAVGRGLSAAFGADPPPAYDVLDDEEGADLPSSSAIKPIVAGALGRKEAR
jgi:hypothetical protein